MVTSELPGRPVRVRRTFFPSGWYFFYLVTTGWIFDSLCEKSINQSNSMPASILISIAASCGTTKLSVCTLIAAPVLDMKNKAIAAYLYMAAL